MRARATPRLVAGLIIAAVAVTLVVLVPAAAGTTWSSVPAVWHQVSLLTLGLLAALWIGGLACNSVALAAGLPGLTTRRALLLSLTGSAVANVLPLGGAAGVGVNFAMVRRWGHSARSFAAYTSVTNIWDIATKLTVVAVASLVVVVGGGTVPLRHGVLGTALGVALALPIAASLLLHEPSAAALGRWLDRRAKAIAGRLGREWPTNLEARLLELSRLTWSVVRQGWYRLTLGSLAYAVLQAALLWGCMHAVGLNLDLPSLAAAFGVDRLLTLVPFTPGGAGVVEAGVAGALATLGAPPGSVVAGVLLYRGFTYLAEIPVGGALLAIWSLRQRRQQEALTTPEPVPVASQSS